MTLIVGLIAKDGIVLTTDSRMTTGNPQTSTIQSNDTVKKIFKISDHCAMGISGSGETCVTLVEEFQKEIAKDKKKTISVLEIADRFRQLCINRYSDWFKRLPPDSERIPDFSVLVCGYMADKNNNLKIPRIVRLQSYTQFAPMTTTTGFATLGIPTIANYLLNRLYLRDTITLEQALTLGAFCIIETISQDGRVGGKLQAATFSNIKKYEDLGEKEINELSVRCDEVLKSSFQVSFYKEKPKEEPASAIGDGQNLPQKDAVKTKQTGRK